ncbi:uncharacterized protein ASCRUDRAFT_30298 [Ascoidea rubescens DSM 1968]|uniref:DUF866-domain-containing protein n=1 Tax=Ascoidea rubescens DSM 1968 TaxID=1344418 RepID=A0A1D2VSL4_9ASCO|nr:hypothetical protein ASCRUDRAFT_30298 [Ascoidea rubescens DSM 1968]ODV64567.1 hypothetical protein ASCRUDRAFT_30298 [Ascoidea rubescens DSM 1968]
MSYSLVVSADLDNVTDMMPLNTPEAPFEFTFRVKCTTCQEVHGKEITINTFEAHDISGSRGSASLVFKCSFCGSRGTKNISITPTNLKLTNDDSQRHKQIPFLDINSRGCEIIQFIPANGYFTCSGLDSSTTFDEIDLADDEWYDYDDNSSNEVSITNVKWDFIRVKGRKY